MSLQEKIIRLITPSDLWSSIFSLRENSVLSRAKNPTFSITYSAGFSHSLWHSGLYLACSLTKTLYYLASIYRTKRMQIRDCVCSCKGPSEYLGITIDYSRPVEILTISTECREKRETFRNKMMHPKVIKISLRINERLEKQREMNMYFVW